MRLVALISPLLFVAACQMSGGNRISNDKRPSAISYGATAQDNLDIGNALMDSGQFDAALKAYYRAAGQNGLTVDILAALGSANLKMGRLGQAETLLRQAVAKDPEFTPILNNLGVVLMEKGDTAEAIAFFRKAYAQDSGASDKIRDNLRLALAKFEKSAYPVANNDSEFALVRYGGGEYRLRKKP